MRRAARVLAPLTAGLVLVPAAVAATPGGNYVGWQVTNDGDRIAKTRTALDVRMSGRTFELRTRNFKVSCPYLDRDGSTHYKWMKLTFRGRIAEDDTVNGLRKLKGGTQRVRVRGAFDDQNRFAGRVSVQSQRGIAGACTGSHRIKLKLEGAVG